VNGGQAEPVNPQSGSKARNQLSGLDDLVGCATWRGERRAGNGPENCEGVSYNEKRDPKVAVSELLVTRCGIEPLTQEFFKPRAGLGTPKQSFPVGNNRKATIIDSHSLTG
jgi:hypothetical protein